MGSEIEDLWRDLDRVYEITKMLEQKLEEVQKRYDATFLLYSRDLGDKNVNLQYTEYLENVYLDGDNWREL